jgi:nitroreductase
MIDSARLSGSAANRQRIRFALVNDKPTSDAIFQNVAFAGYLKDWAGPTESERPTAYIVMMCKEENIDTSLAIDMGIYAEAILLTATEMGLGGCMLGAFSAEKVSDALALDKKYVPTLILALGKPDEEIVLHDADEITAPYYRDEDGIHHVPKRKLEDIII